MSWEDEDWEPPKTVTVKSSWDDEDEEEETKPIENLKDPLPKPKKKPLKEKIAEREAEESEKKKREQEKRDRELELLNETPQQRRLREQQQIIDSDLQNAKELFDMSSTKPIEPTQSNPLLDISNLDIKPSFIKKETDESIKFDSFPKTKQEFENYVQSLMIKFSSFESLGSFNYFVELLLKELCQNLSLEDTRKISSTLSILINEKTKSLSNKKKKPGNKKAQVKTVTENETTSGSFNLYEGEYDDFM